MTLFRSDMPLPLLNDLDTVEFWTACGQHRLVVQRCADCGSFRFAPAPICHHCRSFSYVWEESQGIGEVYTWTVTHRAFHQATADVVPYNTVVVRLDDCGGAMVVSNLLGVENESIRSGMKVQVVWDDVTEDCSVPRFRALRARSD